MKIQTNCWKCAIGIPHGYDQCAVTPRKTNGMNNKTTTETRGEIENLILHNVDCLPLAASWLSDQIMQLIAKEKQELLERVDKEVIGSTVPFIDLDPQSNQAKYYEELGRHNLQIEQRKKLAEIKEGKGEKCRYCGNEIIKRDNGGEYCSNDDCEYDTS